jgi:hypothetical protein
MEEAMSEYITDSELLKRLNSPEAAPASSDEGYISDPELLKKLGEPTASQVKTGPVAPAFYPAGPTRMLEMGKGIAEAVVPPVVTTAKNVYKGYMDKPAKMGIDVVSSLFTGIPVTPIMEGFKTTKDAFEAAKTASKNSSDWLSIFARNLGADADRAAQILEKLPESENKKLIDFLEKNGIKNLKDYKLSPNLQEQFGDAIKTLAKSTPTGTEKAVALAKPFLKTAGKVLGPAGMALDLYSASEMARDTKLGERLQAGEGSKAMKAFKQMNVPYSMMNYSPEEIQYLKANASERDLKALGIK